MKEETSATQKPTGLSVLYASKLKSPVYSKTATKEFILSPTSKLTTPTKRSIYNTNAMSNLTNSLRKPQSTPEIPLENFSPSPLKSYPSSPITFSSKRQRSFVMDYGSSQKISSYPRGNKGYPSSPSVGTKQHHISQTLLKTPHSHELNLPAYISPEKKSLLQETPPTATNKNKHHLPLEKNTNTEDRSFSTPPLKKYRTDNIQSKTNLPEQQSQNPAEVKVKRANSGILYTPPKPISSVLNIHTQSRDPLRSQKGKELEHPASKNSSSQQFSIENKSPYTDVPIESVSIRNTGNEEETTSFIEGTTGSNLERTEEQSTPTLNSKFYGTPSIRSTKEKTSYYDSPRVQMDISHEDSVDSPRSSISTQGRISPLLKKAVHTDTTHERSSTSDLLVHESKKSIVVSISNYEFQELPLEESNPMDDIDSLPECGIENISESQVEALASCDPLLSSVHVTPNDSNITLTPSEIEDSQGISTESVQIDKLSQEVEPDLNTPSLPKPLELDPKVPIEQISSTEISQDISEAGVEEQCESQIHLSFDHTQKRLFNSISTLGETFFQATYMLDKLFPLSCSRAFISPHGTSRLYTPRKSTFNLAGLEKALWEGEYPTLRKFQSDLTKMASIVRKSYDDTDVIFFVARDFLRALGEIMDEIYTQDVISEFQMNFQQYWETLTIDEIQNIYAVKILNQQEAERSHMELLAKEITESIHYPILDLLNHPFKPSVVRLFVSQNRTTLETCRDDPNGVLLILSNIQYDKVPDSKKTIVLKADCFVCKPIGERHDIDEVEVLQNLDSTKTWIKVLVFKIVKLDLEVPISLRSQLSKPFKPFLCKTDHLREHLNAEWSHMTPKKLDKLDLQSIHAMNENHAEIATSVIAPLEEHVEIATSAIAPLEELVETATSGITPSEEHVEDHSTVPVQPLEEPLDDELLVLEDTSINFQHTALTVVNSFTASTPTSPVTKQEVDSPVIRFDEVEVNDETINEDSIAFKLSRSNTPILFPNRDLTREDLQEALVLDPASHFTGESSKPTKKHTTWSEKIQSTSLASQPQSHPSLNSGESIESPGKDKGVIPIASAKFSRELDEQIEDFDERPVRGISVTRPKSIADLYQHFKIFAYNLGVKVEKLDDNYKTALSSDAVDGFFKSVHGHLHNPNVVIQLYKEINESTFQGRLMEVLCLVKLKGTKRIGEIMSILENETNQLAGLTMLRCQKTLKDYLHARHKITSQQKYKIIRDMIVAVKVMHENGIVHRDLSEINVMVNEKAGSLLKDNSLRPKAVIIDFGRALFVKAEDVSKWSVRKYGFEELKLLPKIHTSPDHGYKRYRSICTLPKHKQDHDILPYPVDPLAEDIYSLGILIWRTLSQQNPWPGVFDDDIRGLREIVGSEDKMRKEICKSIKGTKCRELLYGCLAVNPQERWTSKLLFDWIWNTHNRRRLIREFEAHFQGRNASRKPSNVEE